MHAPQSARSACPLPAVALAVAVPAILLLAILPFVQWGDGTDVPRLALFLGRFHPTLLHLPVAFLLLALLVDLTRLPRLRPIAPAVPDAVLDGVVWLSALSGVAAAAAGWLLAHEGGYDASLLDRHLWAGVATGIGALGCALLRSFVAVRPDRPLLPRLATGLLAATCATMVVAAHAGGSLTHGEGYLTEHAPAPLRRLVGLPVPRDRSREPLRTIAEREAFDGVVLRIFEARCLSCHNQARLKGDLRLDTHAAVLKGGGSGAVVDAADPGSSELLRRLRLPVEDEQHMPPSGKAQPTDDEIDVLAWWIERGAPDTDTLAALGAPPQVRAAIERSLPERERRAVAELQRRQAAEYEATLARLREAVPGSLRAITPGDRALEYTAAIAGADFGDPELRELGAVGPELVWLDLSRTAISDAGLETLAGMPKLERLDLRETGVSDAGVEALAGLDRLETLSLYGTGVTDEGLAPLLGLEALRRLYLGGTGVTEAGVESLRQARPEIEVTP